MAAVSGTGPLVTFTRDNASIAFTLLHSRKVPVSFAAQGATYANILPHVDLVYQMMQGGVKESIVLHRAQAPHTFTFLVDTAHVMVREVPSQGILFYDQTTHQPIAIIPNPTIRDASGATSKTAVSMQSSPLQNGQLSVTVSVQDAWLKQAQFPVTIDPSIVSATGPAWTPSQTLQQGMNPKGLNGLGNVDYASLAMLKPGSTPQEILSLRTNHSQTFLNPNGTYTTHIFANATFYKDKKGAWQTLNEALTASANPTFAYQNTAGPFTAQFAAQSVASNTVSFTNQGDTLSFGPVSGNVSTGVEQGNQVTYPQVFSNTDLQYNVLPQRVQENILMHSAAAPSSFAFTLNTKGLTFTQKADGSIVFTDATTHDFVAQIPAPYMYDATGATSYAVKQTIVDQGNGTALLTVTPDAAWVHASGRVFPVVIDPTLTSNSNNSSLLNTFVSSQYPSTNYSGNGNTTVDAGNSSFYGTMRALIGFDNLPPLMPGATGATIVSATLSAFQTNGNEAGTPISVLPITQNWNAQSATWANQPTVGAAMNTQTTAALPSPTGQSISGTWQFNVTSAVKSWYSEQADNYGFELVAPSGATEYASFASYNSITHPAPTLSITYTVQPVGNEPFWSQSSDGVNLADGNLEVLQTDLSTPGRGYPVSISRTYNSMNATAEPPGHTNLFGNGWSSNLDMSIANWGHGPILFTDANGLQHIFVPSNKAQGYIATGAEHLTLTVTSSGGYLVTEQDGTQIAFNAQRKLTSITVPTATQSQVTSFLYNSAGQLDGIQDPSGRLWSVSLNSNGTIQAITDPAGREITYTYDASGDLTGVTVASQAGSTDQTKVSYGYGTSGLLTSMTDANDNTTAITYQSGTAQVHSVSTPITVSGAVVQATDTYTYGTTSGNATTTVTDANGHQVLYTTGNAGTLLSSQVDPSGLNLTTTYAWNQADQVTGVTDPNGNTTTMSYDNAGKSGIGTGVPTASQLANGAVSQISSNAYGSVVGIQNTNGSSTSNRYQGIALSSTMDPTGKTTLVSYDSNGNPLTVSAPLGMGHNLIPNGSFESVDAATGLPLYWESASGNGTIVDTTATAKLGAHALMIQAGSLNPTYLLQNEQMPIHPNESYVLSFWVKTVGVQGYLLNTGPIGAVINAHWYTASGAIASGSSPAPSIYLGNTLGTTGWTRESVVVTAPSDAYAMNLNLVLYGTTGTAYWDGVQLAPINGNGVNSANALVNSSFQNQATGAQDPGNWSVPNGEMDLFAVDTSVMHNGLPSVWFEADTANPVTLSQTVQIPAWDWNGVSFSVNALESGGTAPTSSSAATYQVSLQASYSGTTHVATFTLPFSFTSGWQNKSMDLSKAQLMDNNQLPDQLTFTMNYTDASGHAWFNDPQVRFLATSAPVSQNNLLENPGFENHFGSGSLPDSWVASGPGSASATSVGSAGDVHTGQHALAVTPPASGNTAEVVTNTLPVAYQSGTTYTLYGYLHTHGFQANSAYLQLQALSTSGTVLGTFMSPWMGAGGNTPWTLTEVSVSPSQMPSGTANLRVGMVVNPDANGTNPVVLFDDLLLLPSNMQSTMQYDSAGNQVTAVTDALGHTTQWNYQGMDNTSGNYSPNFTGENTGDPSQVTDALGNVSSYTYNKFNQIDSYTYTDSSGGVAGNPTFTYGYDGNGNLTRITDPLGQTVSYTYNQQNEPTSQTQTVNGVAETTTESYNAAGLLTGVSDPNGVATTYAYDAANRLQTVTQTKGATTDTFAFSYDKNGNVTSIAENGNAANTFTYNSLNQLVQDLQPFSGSIVNKDQFTLDAQGNVTQQTVTLNATLTSPYDVWTNTYLYDLGSEMLQASDGKGTVQFTYTSRGLMASVHNVNSDSTTFYTYNVLGKVSEVKTITLGIAAGTPSQTLQDETYTYDANGNVTQVTNQLTNAAQTFGYDSQNQLIEETTPSGVTLSYTYDAMGNRTSMADSATGVTTTYGYNAEGNRLLSVGGTALSYDASGQMTAYGTTGYVWNAENQLASVSTPSGTTTFTYDALGRRVTIGSEHLGYNGSSNLVSYVTDANDNVVQRFTYNAAGLPILMSMAQGGSWYTYAYVYDGLGQIVGLIDETPGSATLGQEVTTYTYDAWGNLLSHTDTSGTGVATSNPFLYKGYWYDWSTGLYDLNARYYNPALGRFLSVDPVGAQVGSGAPGYNGYAYASNNPVNRVDPSGMLPEEEEGGLGGGGGGAMSIGDPLASGASGGLGGGGGGGASLSGMLINDSASVSTELDQLINNMDGNGFVNEGTGEASTGLRGIVKAKGLPTDGRFHFVADGNKVEFNRSKGGYVDRYGNVWVKGPYHGDPKLGFTYEWDVQLSASGKNAWGKFANGKGYINVRPDGGLSH
ncbi:DNRLRE domain-containing protein [Ferroacidibacillus organovorans]|uniref:DNRLRE domain-containing protein n=1 Tax=Ferroacidibacillus organovorans TaxID=1765683 RepID=UPI001C4DFC4F|nr:DNRLRE domain-containing protein [Ferroacidibacillus organovorans]